jgi:hypothetical protein
MDQGLKKAHQFTSQRCQPCSKVPGAKATGEVRKARQGQSNLCIVPCRIIT